MGEQRTRTHEAAPAEAFDEAWYLASYPDVAEAVARGEFASGRAHYLGYGRREGRLPRGAATAEGAAATDTHGAGDATAAGSDEAVRRGDVRS